MRLLGRGGVSRTWCSASVEAPTAPARPRPGERRHRQHGCQQVSSRGATSSTPQPTFLWLPAVDYVSSSGTPSSSSSSSSSGGQLLSFEQWQLAYCGGGGSQPLVPLQLYTAPLAFLEHGEGLQRRPWQELSHFRVQLGEPQPPQQQDKHKDYYANVGDCIRTLREDIPLLFSKDLNYSIYRDDVVFKDQRVSFKGLRNYKMVIWSLRFNGKLFFKQPYVEVLRIWQPEDNIIKMRWAVHGKPRLWWTDHGQFDGVSTYKLDKNGQIYEHAIDNMQLRDPPITNPLLYAMNLIGNPTLVPQQTPCPGAWYREEEEGVLPGPAMPAGQQ
ncbi:hypothetical protein N2152v2_001320 [Parachlorella kessleri]